jgi:TonB family protein
MSHAADTLTPVDFSLPLVGENHPLRKRFRRTFIWSAIIAMSIHSAAAGGRIAVARFLEARRPPPEKVVRFVSIENVVPPSITQEEAPAQVSLAAAVSQPTIGIPEPVPDYEATEITMATAEEVSQFQTSDLSALTGGGDSLIVNFEAGLPSPDEYVAVEEMPALINLPRPEYPEIARSAGVEGVVVLKLLVGKTGDVEKVMYVSGPEMLKESAIDAAKQAKFKPALQQHRPVAVWVQIPLEFSLQS